MPISPHRVRTCNSALLFSRGFEYHERLHCDVMKRSYVMNQRQHWRTFSKGLNSA